MSRHTNRGRRFNPQAYKEKRSSRVIKAFRVLDPESSSELSGIVRDLEKDNTLPVLKSIPGCHIAYILDPHTVRKEFSSGFRAGFNLSEAKQRIKEEGQEIQEETISYVPARVGEISILGSSNNNRKLIAAKVESRALAEERRAIYEILGEEGLRGFEAKQYKRFSNPIIILATTIVPVNNKLEQARIQDAIETSVLVHQAFEIGFGPLQVV